MPVPLYPKNSVAKRWLTKHCGQMKLPKFSSVVVNTDNGPELITFQAPVTKTEGLQIIASQLFSDNKNLGTSSRWKIQEGNDQDYVEVSPYLSFDLKWRFDESTLSSMQEELEAAKQDLTYATEQKLLWHIDAYSEKIAKLTRQIANN